VNRCDQFGVEPDQREICEVTQTNYSSEMTVPFNTNDDPSTIDEVDLNNPPDETSSDMRIEQSVEITQMQLACEESANANSNECAAYYEVIDDTSTSTEVDEGEL
jgi:hypothetical protein